MCIRNIFGFNILRYIFLSLVIILGLITIIGSGKRQLTPEELAYDRRVNSQPTYFTLQNEQAEEAWSRAHQFIATYSNFRIQTATKYVIQTYMTKNTSPKYAYSVTRTISGNNIHHFQSNALVQIGLLVIELHIMLMF